jgi:HEAT repeat protein
VLSAALYSGDGQWAEELVYKLIDHSDALVRSNAMLSLSHIARVHGTLDRQRAIDVLRVARNDRDESVRSQAEDALEDVQHFIKRTGRWIGSD